MSRSLPAENSLKHPLNIFQQQLKFQECEMTMDLKMEATYQYHLFHYYRNAPQWAGYWTCHWSY